MQHKFFISGDRFVYPKTPVELREQILEHALKGPQKYPFQFFNEYFNNGGGIDHPLLGNLKLLATEINNRWGAPPGDKGLNLVAGLILHRLSEPANFCTLN